MDHEEAQECIKTPFRPRICNKAEYLAALEQLRILSRAPLGMPNTAGVQKLIDAILYYEARHGLEETVVSK